MGFCRLFTVIFLQVNLTIDGSDKKMLNVHDSTTDNCTGGIWCILCGKHCRFISTNKISIYFQIILYTFVGVVVSSVCFFNYYFHYLLLSFICVCFLRLFLCVYVCVDFLCRWVGFFNGRRVCGSLQLYQRQEFNQTNCCLCCLLFKFKIQDIFSYYSCVLWL